MNRTGFTMIELLIATAIIFLLILASSQAVMFSLSLKLRNEAGLAAAEAARGQMELFKSKDFEGPELAAGTYTLSRPFKNHSLIHMTWSIQDISTGLKFIELESSVPGIPTKKIRLCLYKMQELGF